MSPGIPLPRVLRKVAVPVALLAGALVVAAEVAQPARAGIWKRIRADGTEEFTNIPTGTNWKLVPDEGPPAPRTGGGLALRTRTDGTRPGAASGVIWARENDDGTMEFTNLQPVGARWKVLYRTGPGKAAALRGSSDLVPPSDLSTDRLRRYDRHIADQQGVFGIPQPLLRAVIKTESDFDPHVVSSAGAVGLMQLMPETARSMGVTDIWDPRQNIMGGARYLQILGRRFCRTNAAEADGGGLYCSPAELVKVVAAYHAGPGAVDRYGGMPPYETTRSYVTTVLERFDEYRRRTMLLGEGTSRAAAR